MAVSTVRTMNITLLFSISAAAVSTKKKYTVQPAHNDTKQNMTGSCYYHVFKVAPPLKSKSRFGRREVNTASIGYELRETDPPNH